MTENFIIVENVTEKDLEKILHKLYINYDYRPLKNFGGKTECFKI